MPSASGIIDPLGILENLPLAQTRPMAGLRMIRDFAGVLVHGAPLRDTRAQQT